MLRLNLVMVMVVNSVVGSSIIVKAVVVGVVHSSDSSLVVEHTF